MFTCEECDFILCLQEGTLHAGQRVFNYKETNLWLWCHLGLDVENYALTVQHSRESDSVLGQKVVLVLHHMSEWVFAPEWKSRSRTVTAVNSQWFVSFWNEILCWYHVNEYRATRGNRSELILEWKLCHYQVNISSCFQKHHKKVEFFFSVFLCRSKLSRIIYQLLKETFIGCNCTLTSNKSNSIFELHFLIPY